MGGMSPYPLATVLRIHMQQQWYLLSDLVIEEALMRYPPCDTMRVSSRPVTGSRIDDNPDILPLLEEARTGPSGL